MTYLVVAFTLVAFLAIFLLVAAAGYLHQAWMIGDLARRLPQTEAEMIAEQDREWEYEQRLDAQVDGGE